MQKTASKNKKKQTFKEWLDSLNRIDYKVCRLRIIEKCSISPQVFHNCSCGVSTFSLENQAIINELAGKELDYEKDAKRVPLYKHRKLESVAK